jgi:hypothetical protein
LERPRELHRREAVVVKAEERVALAKVDREMVVGEHFAVAEREEVRDSFTAVGFCAHVGNVAHEGAVDGRTKVREREWLSVSAASRVRRAALKLQRVLVSDLRMPLADGRTHHELVCAARNDVEESPSQDLVDEVGEDAPV